LEGVCERQPASHNKPQPHPKRSKDAEMLKRWFCGHLDTESGGWRNIQLENGDRIGGLICRKCCSNNPPKPRGHYIATDFSLPKKETKKQPTRKPPKPMPLKNWLIAWFDDKELKWLFPSGFSQFHKYATQGQWSIRKIKDLKRARHLEMNR